MINIVTCLAIDVHSDDKKSRYKALGRQTKEAKQEIYWKLAYVYFATSTKINKTYNHILYTNEMDNFCYRGFDFKSKIQELGVEIRYLPFQNFYIPQGYSRLFKNAYYKFEVFRELASEDIPSLFTDLDCVWASKWENLEDLIDNYDLLLYDVYQRNHTPFVKHPNNTSMKEMGELFRKLDPQYASEFPTWYGGEFICTSSFYYREITTALAKIFDQLIKGTSQKLLLPNSESLLDGDEYLSSFVYNNRDWKIYDVSGHIKRMWTSSKFSNVQPEDVRKKVWHLPAEKESGFSLLFQEISDQHSSFWSLDPSNVSDFVGHFLGVTANSTAFKWKRSFHYYKNKITAKLRFHFSSLT